MPIYEFRCECCGYEKEVQAGKRPRPGRCPTCGVRLKRKVSLPAIRFKGSGFHKNDY